MTLFLSRVFPWITLKLLSVSQICNEYTCLPNLCEKNISSCFSRVAVPICLMNLELLENFDFPRTVEEFQYYTNLIFNKKYFYQIFMGHISFYHKVSQVKVASASFSSQIFSPKRWKWGVIRWFFRFFGARKSRRIRNRSPWLAGFHR